MADDLDVLMEANKSIYLEKAGDKLDYDTLTELLDAETWLTAEQCVEYGLADTILDYTVDRDSKATQAAAANAVQRADDTIARLQQARTLLSELVEVVDIDTGEEEILETPEPTKPRNFLEIFS